MGKVEHVSPEKLEEVDLTRALLTIDRAIAELGKCKSYVLRAKEIKEKYEQGD